MPGNLPGAFDSPPPYQDESSKSKLTTKAPKTTEETQRQDHIVQLNIDNFSTDTPQLFTTVNITQSTTFEDFQRQVKQRYYEMPRANNGSFIWTTWLWEAEDRESVDAFNWEEIRPEILGLAAAGTLGWKNRPARLEAVFGVVHLGKVVKAKNQAQLQRMLRVHEGNERRLLLGGRHVPAPRLKEDECVVM